MSQLTNQNQLKESINRQSINFQHHGESICLSLVGQNNTSTTTNNQQSSKKKTDGLIDTFSSWLSSVWYADTSRHVALNKMCLVCSWPELGLRLNNQPVLVSKGHIEARRFVYLCWIVAFL